MFAATQSNRAVQRSMYLHSDARDSRVECRPLAHPKGLRTVMLAALLVLCPLALAMDLPLNGVVRIHAEGDAKSREGSGFVVRVAIEGAYIVTAAHVVAGVKEPRVALARSPEAWVVAETLRLEGTLGEEGDGLAVLPAPRAAPIQTIGKIPLADYTPTPDQDVTVIGFPRVMGGLSVLPGRTTRRGRNLVFSQSLEEGFSGSPMLSDGRVIGVVTRSERYGIGVTVNTLKDFLKEAGIPLTPNMSFAFIRKWGSEGGGDGQFLNP